jgi:hypothetical protein
MKILEDTTSARLQIRLAILNSYAVIAIEKSASLQKLITSEFIKSYTITNGFYGKKDRSNDLSFNFKYL